MSRRRVQRRRRKQNPGAGDLLLPALIGGGALLYFMSQRGAAASGSALEKLRGEQRGASALDKLRYGEGQRRTDEAAKAKAAADQQLRASNALATIAAEHEAVINDIVGADALTEADLAGLAGWLDGPTAFAGYGHYAAVGAWYSAIPGADAVVGAAKKLTKKTIKVVGKGYSYALDFAKNPIGAAQEAGDLVGKGLTKTADIVDAGGAVVYRVGGKLVSMAKDPQKFANRGLDYVKQAASAVSDPKNLLQAAWQQTLNAVDSEIIRAFMRSLGKPLISTVQKVAKEGLPAVLALGGGAALAQSFYAKGNIKQVHDVAAPLIKLGTKKLADDIVGQLDRFVPNGPAGLIQKFWDHTAKGPMVNVLSTVFSQVAVSVASGEAVDIAAAISGLGVLSPLTISISKASQALVSYAANAAVGTVVSHSESTVRGWLGAVGVKGDFQKLVLDALKGPVHL